MTGTAAVEVIVHVAAPPQNVFPYLIDPARYVQWMGSQATLDPVVGGAYRVHMSDGFRAAGTFLQVEPPHQVAFSWGFADEEAARHVLHEPAGARSAGAMPAASTRVTVTLDAEDGGTRVTLRHDDLASDELRHGHRIAWQAYLQRLAIRAAGGDPGPDPHA
jgi:uncharacterized protein YndB with AHSA1/START domain